MGRKKVLALFMAAALSFAPVVTANAAELTSATDASNVKYGTLTAEDEALLTPLFDYEFYKKTNPDVVNKLGDDRTTLLNHFLKCGLWEGRSLNENLNISVYASAYQDVADAAKGDVMFMYRHYVTFAQKESRTITTLKAAAEAGVTVHPVANPSVELTPAVIKVAEEKGITDPAVAITATNSAGKAAESSGGSSSSTKSSASTKTDDKKEDSENSSSGSGGETAASSGSITLNDLTLLNLENEEFNYMWVEYSPDVNFDGSPEEIWESSDESVATVSEYGYVTPVSAGTTTIKVTVKQGEFEASDTATLTIVDPDTFSDYSIKFKESSSTFKVNEYEYAYALVEFFPRNAPVTFTSSDTETVEVVYDGHGFEPKKTGTATITAKIGSGENEKTATLEVTVVAAESASGEESGGESGSESGEESGGESSSGSGGSSELDTSALTASPSSIVWDLNDTASAPNQVDITVTNLGDDDLDSNAFVFSDGLTGVVDIFGLNADGNGFSVIPTNVYGVTSTINGTITFGITTTLDDHPARSGSISVTIIPLSLE